MQELIKEIRKNRNAKYYELLAAFFTIVSRDVSAPIRLTVEEIIEEVDISRPTFYTYYENVEEFYVDLMEIISTLWPQYMKQKSEEMQQTDFLRMAYELKMGVTLSNMKKIAGKFPGVMIPWNAFFENAVENMGSWYSSSKNMSAEDGRKTARFVLNELVLHDDKYYSDFEVYRALMLSQETN